jgi:hypothetical protein
MDDRVGVKNGDGRMIADIGEASDEARAPACKR